MDTPLDVYREGMHRLLARMGHKHPQYNLTLLYQMRLEENIQYTLQFGNTETRSSERWEIIYTLNSLAREAVGVTFNSICMSKNIITHSDIQDTKDFYDLSFVRNYIEVLWETTRDARSLFKVGSEGDIWPPQCEQIINGFSRCRKPTLPSEAPFSQLEVTLAYLDEVAHVVISLVDEFSPNGRKTSRQAVKQRGKIREQLQKLPQEIEAAIAFIGSLEHILLVQQEEPASWYEGRESTPPFPGRATGDRPSSADDPTAEEPGETHPRAS